MVLLDTNVFVIDRFFRRDDRYDANKAFLDLMTKTEAGFSISLCSSCVGFPHSIYRPQNSNSGHISLTRYTR
jgi:hypothetical protein